MKKWSQKIKVKEKDLEKRKVVINTTSKLYDKLSNIYTTQYGKLSEDSKKRVNVLKRSECLTFDFDEDDLPLEGDEEAILEPGETIAKEIKLNPQKRKITGTGLIILTPNKLITRLPVLLAQIKTGINSNKFKNEIRQILYLLYQHINQVIIKMEENMIVVRDPKNFYFPFHWPKDVDQNLKRENKFIIKIS